MATDPFVSFPFTAAGFPEGIRVHQNFDDILKYIRERNDGTVAWDTATFSGVVKLADGTVGAPSLTFSASGNSDNGIYRIGTDNWGLSAGGVNVADFAATLVTFPIKTAIKGTATNDNAAAGFVGEYVQSTVSAQSVGTSNQYEDVTSISLTAGDWDISAFIQFDANGASVTNNTFGVSTTSGNSSAGLTGGVNSGIFINPTAASSIISWAIPSIRVSLSGTTTHYMKLYKLYSVATPRVSARLSARRVR